MRRRWDDLSQFQARSRFARKRARDSCTVSATRLERWSDAARGLGRPGRAIERRRAAPLQARLRSRAPRFPPAQLERAIFRRGTCKFAWSVTCHARFFDKYILRRHAMLPEPVQATTRSRERARAREYACWHGFRGLSGRRCCFQRPSAGSDAAGVGDARRTFGSPSATRKLRLPLPDRSAGTRPGLRARVSSQKLEVKLYAVLQLSGGDVSRG
jgi:hypothetical protein